MSTQSNS